jgi:hypothetical protein
LLYTAHSSAEHEDAYAIPFAEGPMKGKDWLHTTWQYMMHSTVIK